MLRKLALLLPLSALVFVTRAENQTTDEPSEATTPQGDSNSATKPGTTPIDEKKKDKDKQTSPTANAVAQGLIDKNFVNGNLSDELRKVVDELLEQTRLDQDTVRAAVRQINTNLDSITKDDRSFGCESVTTDRSASPELLESTYAATNVEQIREFAAKRPDVLRNPIVAAHPELLSSPAVQANPDVLNNPAARKNWKLLLDPKGAVAKDPALFVKPQATNPAESTGNTCTDFVREVRRINRNLLIESYADSIKQNANLSNQIATRLGELVDDSTSLTSANKRERFLYEYTLLTERFLHSRQFRVGFGAAYSYLPKITYTGAALVDLSPFQTLPTGGSDHLFFGSDFSNESSFSPFVSAKAPFFDIDFLYPDLETTQTTITPIQFLAPDDTTTQILAQSTVTSTLSIEYEIGIRVGIGNLIERHRVRSALKDTNELGTYYPKNTRARFDWGVGIGLSGFHVDNTAVTDVRFRTDTTSRFSELVSKGSVTTSSGSSFKTGFLIGYYKFRISDEFEVGVDYRKYEKNTADGGRIAFSGDTLSITAAYYPTFHKKKKGDDSNPSHSANETAPKDTDKDKNAEPAK